MKILKTSKARFSILLIAVLLTFSSAAASNRDRQWRDSVCLRIDSLLNDSMFSSSQIGMCIYDLSDNNVLYACNEIQTMRPASTQKLITAITALNTLGNGYRMYTTLNYTGNINGRTLDGNIYCRGCFDPLIGSDCLKKLAREVKTFGIDTIRGGFFIDKSMKDSLEYGKGWCWDDDNPVLSPLTCNGNDDFYHDMLQALHNEGVVTETNEGFGTCPEDAVMIASTYHTIENILPEMLKESNNFYAEAMFYNLAASSRKPRASADDAAAKIERLAEALGHKKSEFRVADGSGLSLYNYTTPMIEVDFLRYAYDNRNIFNTICAALPIAGVDGTLKKRMKKYPNTMRNVRAKTGSLSCVSSLAGYCTAANGHDLAFCIINQGVLRSKEARRFQDMVCAILCEPLNTKLN